MAVQGFFITGSFNLEASSYWIKNQEEGASKFKDPFGQNKFIIYQIKLMSNKKSLHGQNLVEKWILMSFWGHIKLCEIL